MKKILQNPMAILFGLFVMVIFAVDVFNADRTFSDFENKKLSSKPSFSWSSFVSGSFGNNYVKYINDQFVGRDDWITLKAAADQGLGRIESHGITYADDGYLFEKLELVPERLENSGTNVVAQQSMERSVGMLRSFLQMYDQDITVSLVPNSYAILGNKVPEGFPGVDQLAETQEIYDDLTASDDGVQVIDFADTLSAHDDEYICYHTDHHWTTLGAYYAYVEYCNQKGLTPVELSSLEANEVEDFYGTFYSKAKRPGQEPDTITWYDVPVEQFAFTANLDEDKELASLGELKTIDGMELLEVNGLMDTRKFDTRDKYAAFTWGNAGYTKIVSSNNLNHEEGKTSRLLLFKDSYANSMIPFLTYNYDEIVVVDLRTLAKSVSELMKEDFDDIFVMYNFSTFISDASNLAKLKY